MKKGRLSIIAQAFKTSAEEAFAAHAKGETIRPLINAIRLHCPSLQAIQDHEIKEVMAMSVEELYNKLFGD